MTFYNRLGDALKQAGINALVHKLNTKTNAYTGFGIGMLNILAPVVLPHVNAQLAAHLPPTWAGVAISTVALALATVGRPKDFSPPSVPTPPKGSS